MLRLVRDSLFIGKAQLRYHFFFFNDTATTEIYTLSLHDALPIWATSDSQLSSTSPCCLLKRYPPRGLSNSFCKYSRSEEHTSELQSHLNLVCRLLLEKKKDTPPRPPAIP